MARKRKRSRHRGSVNRSRNYRSTGGINDNPRKSTSGKGKPINTWALENAKKPINQQDDLMRPCPPFCQDPYEPYAPDHPGGIEGELGWSGMGGGGNDCGFCPCGQSYCNLSCTWTNLTNIMYKCVWPADTNNCVDADGDQSYAYWDGCIFSSMGQCSQQCQGGCFCEACEQGDSGGQWGWSWIPVNGCGTPSQCNGPSGCCEGPSSWSPDGVNDC